jgi:hypothetical protein
MLQQNFERMSQLNELPNMDEALEGPTALGYGEDVLKRTIAEATGLSWGILTRYNSTFRRVKAAAAAAGKDVEALLSPGFNGVEAGIRLYDRSAADGLEALLALHSGSMSAVQVRRKLDGASTDRLNDALASRSRLLRRRGLEIDAMEKALVRHSAQFFPKDSTAKRRPALRYFRKVGMEVRRKDGTCVCWLDLMASEADNAAGELDAGLAKTILLSTYFPMFFLFFSAGSPEEAVKEAVAALDLVDVPWLGVMRVIADGTIEIVRRSVGRPVPERTSEYESLRAKLAHGRHTE